MSIKDKAIDFSVITEALDEPESIVIIGVEQHIHKSVMERKTMGAHVRQVEFGDIHDHSVKPSLGVLGRKILVLMFVVGHEIYLGNFPWNNPMVGLRKGGDFKPPIVGEIHPSCHPCQKAEFSRKRVFETSVVVKELFQLMVSPFVHDGFQRIDERRHKDSGHPALHHLLRG